MTKFNHPRRRWLAAGVAAGLARPALSQAPVPSNLRIIVGFAAGGGADAVSRLLAEKMREYLPGGTQIVVENKLGGQGKIAVDTIRAAAADGSSLLVAPLVTPVLSQLVFRAPGYDPAKDLVPIGMIGHFQFALVVAASHPARTVAEFSAWLKLNKAKATYGTPSAGSLPHFFGLMLGKAVGAEIVHVPYKGGAPMLADLLGGQIACGIDTEQELIELHKAGKIRVLAMFSPKRSAQLPDVPTMLELGYREAVGSGWYSMWTTVKTPVATVAALNGALNKALVNADVKERFSKWALDAAPASPESLEQTRQADIAKWRPVIAASGFQAD